MRKENKIADEVMDMVNAGSLKISFGPEQEYRVHTISRIGSTNEMVLDYIDENNKNQSYYTGESTGFLDLRLLQLKIEKESPFKHVYNAKKV